MGSYFIDDFAADHEAEMEIEAEMEAEMDEPEFTFSAAGKCAFCGDPCNPAEQTCHDCRR